MSTPAMGSWWNDKERKLKPERARGKAQAYADKLFNRNNHLWDLAYKSYLAGYLKSQREKFAEIRLKIKT